VPDILTSVLSSTWSIFLVVLFFGGSIFVHELGHFLAARRRGVRVERFSIGFGPAIWSWRGKDGVEYRLAWFPLGGYVLLPQLADMAAIEGESQSDATRLPPVSYSTKLIVFVAGATFNVLFAFLLATVLWITGVSVAEEDQTTRIGIARPRIEVAPGKIVPGPAYTAGLRTGDTIVAVDGKAVNSFSDVAQLIALGSGRNEQRKPQVAIAYERDGQRMPPVLVQPELVGPEEIRDIGVEPAVKVTINDVVAGSAAEQAGVKAGDVLTAIDGRSVNYSSFVEEHLRATNGQPVELSLVRDGSPLTLRATPRKVIDPRTNAEVHRLGVSLRGSFTIKAVHIAPWKQVWRLVVLTWRNVISLVSPSSDVGLNKMSGAVGIVRIFYSAAEDGMRSVLALTILININLAIFNLLPIPVLDGGHIMFATIARLRRRALPTSFILTTQSVFMVLLLTMILYVGFFDVRRWSRDRAERSEPAPKAVAPAPAPAPAGK
jgi:regulator of sigma E protease